MAVYVYSFIPHARVEVFAGGAELIGKAEPVVGFANIPLTRPLKVGEKITATQTVDGVTSVQSYVPVEVTAYPPGGLNKPVVAKDLYECGRIAPVDKLVPSVQVLVFGDGSKIGESAAPQPWEPVWTDSLKASWSVTAQQLACPQFPAKTIKSPPSDPVTVKPEPNPLQAPGVDSGSLVVGNDTVTLYNLYTGAEALIADGGSPVSSGWFATGPANWFPISSPLTGSSVITAQQRLCGPASPPSDPVKPTGDLAAPEVLAPICEGQQYALVRGTKINANVMLLRNGGNGGYSGAAPGDVPVFLGGGGKFNSGDLVQAFQSMGPTLSPGSNVVTVVGQLRQPAVWILGGEPFFNPEQGEDGIDGPVFPRGRGAGPLIAVQACCNSGVSVIVRGVDGAVVQKVPMLQVAPGYYMGTWDWTSSSGWTVPDGIPVGAYTVEVKANCQGEGVTKKLYVIFNPADVGGPARFSFDETGIWFGSPPSNLSRALVYHLHPDDARIFGKAIAAASGMTNSAKAAEAVATAEEALFSYSLSYHTDDTLQMLASFTEAQCADDANMLAALLRAIGIPAHPATADAALETKQANWTFDTWTEMLIPSGGKPQWLIIHPHEFPGMGPEARNTFGTTRGVAKKSFNDLVMMANENWVWNEVADGNPDVTYDRNECAEPQERHLSAAAWLDDLCEGKGDYWSPSNHWACPSSAHASSIRVDWRPRLERLEPGGRLEGTLTVANPTRRSLRAFLVVEIVSDLDESKAFPDEVLQRVAVKSLRLAPGGRTSVPVAVDLPRTVPRGQHLYLRATLGRQTVLVQPLAVAPTLTVRLAIRGDRQRDGEILAVGSVANVSAYAVERIEATLDLPPGLRVVSRPDVGAFTLNPGENRELTWRLTAIAPLEAGSLVLTAASTVDGWGRAVQPIAIPAEVDASAISSPARKP
jgi:hypothetical protein